MMDDAERLKYAKKIIDLMIELNIIDLTPYVSKQVELGLYLTNQECQEIAKTTIYSTKQIRNWFFSLEELSRLGANSKQK